jgi:predicted metalloprotease
MRLRRSVLALMAAIALLLSGGCGGEEIDRARERVVELRRDLEARVERAQRRFEERRERFGRRIREILDDFEKVVPQPERTSPVVRSRGRNEPETIDVFLTKLLQDIDRYWTRTLRANDLPEPQVRYAWVPPGRVAPTSCGTPAGDDVAFYCPTDDTIYVGQQFAADLYNGVARGLPGERAGFGRAAGDFAVAYVVAHEYAHNLQQELGIFDNRQASRAEPFELQADCFAGTWANSVYRQGQLEPGDLEEATNAALAVGDFEFGSPQHHGTPEERRDALLAGFRSGEPAVCSRYVSAT